MRVKKDLEVTFLYNKMKSVFHIMAPRAPGTQTRKGCQLHPFQFSFFAKTILSKKMPGFSPFFGVQTCVCTQINAQTILEGGYFLLKSPKTMHMVRITNSNEGGRNPQGEKNDFGKMGRARLSFGVQ